jgi:hypothetical protein
MLLHKKAQTTAEALPIILPFPGLFTTKVPTTEVKFRITPTHPTPLPHTLQEGLPSPGLRFSALIHSTEGHAGGILALPLVHAGGI